VGAALTLLGILAFVAIGQPQGSATPPTGKDWLVSGLSIFVLIVLLAWIATQRRGAVAATLFAAAAGIGFAYQAAAAKLFMTQIGYGLGVNLTSWTTYALII
jgi:hypothetical protein